jgi:hypothetical protein
LPFTVISELIGVPEQDRADLGRWFRTLLAPDAGPQPPAETVAASDGIVVYLHALLDLKRRALGEDLVTDLIVAADRDGALTEQEAPQGAGRRISGAHAYCGHRATDERSGPTLMTAARTKSTAPAERSFSASNVPPLPVGVAARVQPRLPCWAGSVVGACAGAEDRGHRPRRLRRR